MANILDLNTLTLFLRSSSLYFMFLAFVDSMFTLVSFTITVSVYDFMIFLFFCVLLFLFVFLFMEADAFSLHAI